MASSDDHVVMIGLHFKFQSLDTQHTERRIRLDKNQKTVQIGRTSKRDPNLSSAMNNGWIDSPVISREHAELSLGDETQPVYIKDLNSRHGTYLNHERLEPNRIYPVIHGDVVKFGIDIQRDEMTWPPPSAQVFIHAKSPSPPVATTAQAQTQHRVFVVPDDSDSSDADSEDEDVQEIRHAVKALREVAGARHPRLTSEVSQVVPPSAQTPTTTAPPPAVHIDITDDLDTISAKVPCVVDLTEPNEIFDNIASSGVVAEEADMNLSVFEDAQRTSTDVSNVHAELSHVRADMIVLDDDDDDDFVSEEERGRLEALVDEMYNKDIMDAASDDDSGIEDSGIMDSDDMHSDDMASDAMESDAQDSDAMDSDAMDSDESDEEESDDMVLWDESEPSSPSPNLLPLYPNVMNDHAMPKANFEGMDLEVGVKTVAAETFDINQGSYNAVEADAQRIPRMIPTESDWPESSDSMPFNSSQAPPLPSSRIYLHNAGNAVQPDYRLRLPSILNNPPSESSPVLVRSSSPPSEVPCDTFESEVVPESSQPTEHVEEAIADIVMDSFTAQDPTAKSAAPIIAQLVPQSPLIESGDRFLAYPLEETDQLNDRNSPELDMSSAWLFQQSKLNNTAKVTATPADEVASEKAPGSTTAGAMKRKATEISDVTEAEEAQQAAALDMIIPNQAELPQPIVEALPTPPAEHDEVHAPKKMRRVAEAARLLALGGAAAGVALFTTLVATAPSFA
ncbi:hypothetical protein F5X68DRAFT_650 [Plectosphaerella plurivora]|uniref:FHA domain-containing protein n=1 Tax=Plectosphaerella plurivora TaxID=936078 RepID=A0A9P8VNN1_9PEZI|nr:hypothetical protein F5X68DRAFT_650 [Plectosphaerella plurivora]